jgi:transcriptional regulator GlxA family with amidase domain
MAPTRNVAILVFPEVEVLDFAGPFEVFAVTGELHEPSPFHVYLVAENTAPITARNGLSVNPYFDLASAPQPEVLIIPGGAGTRPLLNNATVLRWIADISESSEITLSVCTGALLLAKINLLAGLAATTHHENYDELHALSPTTHVFQHHRFVDNGDIITAAGISAGIDASLHVVERLLGKNVALRTAHYMEYRWDVAYSRAAGGSA